MSHIGVYLDDFIGFNQGGKEYQTNMTRNLFRGIYEIFHPNDIRDTASKEPILLKKTSKG